MKHKQQGPLQDPGRGASNVFTWSCIRTKFAKVRNFNHDCLRLPSLSTLLLPCNMLILSFMQGDIQCSRAYCFHKFCILCLFLTGPPKLYGSGYVGYMSWPLNCKRCMFELFFQLLCTVNRIYLLFVSLMCEVIGNFRAGRVTELEGF